MTEMIIPFVRTKAPAGSWLPVLITPAHDGQTLADGFAQFKDQIDAALLCEGGVLLRGFGLASVAAFEAFAASFGFPLLKYEFGSTPRTAVSSTGIYTSTEYPAHQHIPLHNEQAYTREWAMRIWFCCVIPALEGGETPIADSRAVYRRMPEAIRRRFEGGVLYVRNFSEAFDVSWQKVFNTDSRAEVEAFCRQAKILCEWKDDGDLRTKQVCQAVETHPVTGEKVWFNQAHLFHISNPSSEVRETLEDLLGIENVPRNTYFADGSPISDEVLGQVRRVLDAETVIFPWEKDDGAFLTTPILVQAQEP